MIELLLNLGLAHKALLGTMSAFFMKLNVITISVNQS